VGGKWEDDTAKRKAGLRVGLPPSIYHPLLPQQWKRRWRTTTRARRERAGLGGGWAHHQKADLVASPLSVLLLRDLRQTRYYAARPCVRRSCAYARAVYPPRTHPRLQQERTLPRPCAATTGNLVTDHDTHDDKQVGEVFARTYMLVSLPVRK
jgi:hypothetical protein